MNKKRLQLLLGILGIWLFIAVLVPLFTQNKASQQMLNHIEEHDIDTRALFYTESEAAKEAEFLLRSKKISNLHSKNPKE